MSQLKLLEKVIKSLERESIPYMLTGSLVSSFQGSPRSTHDIDIIISIEIDQVPLIMNTFGTKRFYINRDSVKEAIINNGQFNVLDTYEGDKIDFWILTSSRFDRRRFSRRQKVRFSGFEVYISSPEDTIIQKLLWSRLSGGSEKQFEDALGVYELQYDNLDLEYMNYWSKELDIESLYKKIISDAEIEK